MYESGSVRPGIAKWLWLGKGSAVGELLGVNAIPRLMQLCGISDLLVRHRDKIEQALFDLIRNLFGLPVTVTLNDLTNTYFERTAAGNPKATRSRTSGDEVRHRPPVARLKAVIATAAMNQSARSAWCREHGVYPTELETWDRDAISGPGEPRATESLPLKQQERRRIRELARELHRKDKAQAEPAAFLVLSKTPGDLPRRR